MATLSPFSSLCSTCRANSALSPSPSPSSSLPLVQFARFQSYNGIVNFQPNLSVANKFPRSSQLRSVAEGNTLTAEADGGSSATEAEQPVSVPVSPSDVLTMSFLAEGTMNEAEIPKVTKALQEVEGITDLIVEVEEGIASVELMMETTVQATGVASSLVQIIQGAGFKLQTLHLSFEDDEDLK